jgi:protein-S-isoprenylcysteine O-methyltransferase Ste14
VAPRRDGILNYVLLDQYKLLFRGFVGPEMDDAEGPRLQTPLLDENPIYRSQNDTFFSTLLRANIVLTSARSCNKRDVMIKNNLLCILIRWAALMVVVVSGLWLVAGTIHLPMLNAYIVVLAPSLLVMMLAIAPQIAQERGKTDQAGHDIKARSALVILFLATMVIATLDVGHLHLSNNVPVVLSVIALVMFIAASGLQAWAMSVNSFYSPVIHIQAERGHSVITRGPYRLLRHPAYFANIVAVPASALAIGSWVALVPAAVCCAITVWRARREDVFLKQHLAGYIDYMKRVPGGVVPHLSFK